MGKEYNVNIQRLHTSDISIRSVEADVNAAIPDLNDGLNLLVGKLSSKGETITLMMNFINENGGLIGKGRFDASLDQHNHLNLLPNPNAESIAANTLHLGGIATLSRTAGGVFLSTPIPSNKLSLFSSQTGAGVSHFYIDNHHSYDQFDHKSLLAENANIVQELNKHNVKMVAMDKGYAYVGQQSLQPVTAPLFDHPIANLDFNSYRHLPYGGAHSMTRLTSAYAQVNSFLQDENNIRLKPGSRGPILFSPASGMAEQYDLKMLPYLSDDQLLEFAESSHVAGIQHKADRLKLSLPDDVTADTMVSALIEEIEFVRNPEDVTQLCEMVTVALGGETTPSLRQQFNMHNSGKGLELAEQTVRDLTEKLTTEAKKIDLEPKNDNTFKPM